MKILKYIKYRMQGYTKEETYFKMVCNKECSFLKYAKFYDKKVKKGKLDTFQYQNRAKEELFKDLYSEEGETNVSDKRNRGHKRKANRT